MSGPGQDPREAREHDPRELSEAQLRQLYDEEEVERFISLFSTYVTEVRTFSSMAGVEPMDPVMADGLDTVTGRRTPIPPPLPRRPADRSLSEHIAHNYLLPYLPPVTTAAPTFTLKRLGLTTQRLYLAIFPPYHAFLLKLAKLALWKDHQRSLRYCILEAFWFLWFYDLLLPALVFWIAFGLLRRRLLAFPSLEELQERRRVAAQAVNFSDAVQQRLSVTTLGPVEMWRLFKLYKSGGKVASVHPVENEEEENIKRDMLYALNELADVHERIKNIFTWRRPDVSWRYLVFLVAVGFGTLILPVRYVARLVYWFGGMLFWHVTPIIAALPQADRARVSLVFKDAPTDADYAMELITQRIASGQDIGSASLHNHSHRSSSASASTDSLITTLHGTTHEVQSPAYDGINWTKWNERFARGKSFVEGGKRFLITQTLRNQFSGEAGAVYRLGTETEDAHTFLAQHASSPGLITLTSSALFFTSLTGPSIRLVVPRDRLRRVRRSGFLKGISITWAAEDLADGEDRETKFHWVGGRDELFARLAGSDGARWIRM